MIFNNHSNLEGHHAILSASNYRWLNYDDEDLYRKYISSFATVVGDALHELAKDLIENRIKLSKTDKKIVLLHLLKKGIPRSVIDMERIFYNFMTYVNDCIGFGMTPEVLLHYTDFCFGTTDAICFREKEKILIIHDYKSGTTPVKIEQLLIYVALFCLEYRYKPGELDITCRIYQNNEVLVYKPEAEEIEAIIKCMIYSNKFMNKMCEEG